MTSQHKSVVSSSSAVAVKVVVVLALLSRSGAAQSTTEQIPLGKSWEDDFKGPFYTWKTLCHFGGGL